MEKSSRTITAMSTNASSWKTNNMLIQLTMAELAAVLAAVRASGNTDLAVKIEKEADNSDHIDMNQPTDVILPCPDSGPKIIDTFSTGFAAFAWAREHLGADEHGRVTVVRVAATNEIKQDGST